MSLTNWKKHVQAYDDRRDIVIPGNTLEAIAFCVEQFIDIAQESIRDHGFFSVALSGGSTPKAIYQSLSSPFNSSRVDWKRVLLFWSDERSVPKDDPESNYHMAMTSGFATLPIPQENIFRMQAEDNIEENAKAYESLIKVKLGGKPFDLVMLGMGEDGHTASLFPKTHGLHTKERLAIANFVPQKNTWRMTLTFECINASRNIDIYILGKGKAEMLRKVLTAPYDPDTFPIQRIGIPEHKALLVLDKDAAAGIL